ncbi:TPA: conjugal transfer protein [Streptococcus agalactiae]|nr:conjugal transfer protein [Streptococcus agalactiae]HEO2599735.1 conjugal transfer protein [Streptococcus agalactiae]HEO2935450.1 conjugal transfer protein [Streptococcus agalactiae]HEO4680444.1 conjugal transfer protein [Streptococcus agalactiae]
MKRELAVVKNKIKKLKDKKALIDEELEPLFIREEELENEEIIAICRKNNITISDLMAKVNKQRVEMKKEKSNENQFEK